MENFKRNRKLHLDMLWGTISQVGPFGREWTGDVLLSFYISEKSNDRNGIMIVGAN